MLDNRYVRFVIETGKSSTVAASELAGLDRFTIAAEDGALDSMAYVVVRDGDDLVMLFADGTRVVIEDYFTSTASFAFDGLGQAVELPLDAQPIGTVGDKALYAFSGDIDGARTILLESRGFTTLEPLLDDAAIAALPAGAGLPLMLPLALGALVAAGGGSTAAAVIQTTIKGIFLAGPIIDGNGLSVDIFDNKGNLLARDVPLNEDGSFSVTLVGTYTSVIAILRDGNEAADYRDEATGLPRDLTAQLMSVGTGQPQGDGNTLVSLNINPITTIAARNAGLGQDGTIPEGGLSDEQISDANKATADAFGLSDLNQVAPLDIFNEGFNDTDGDVTESEKYGQILAMMSGLDQKNNGDQQAAIEQLAATLRNANDADAAQQQVKDSLTEGAVEFEFKNTGNTENEANLLSSPALGIVNTPEVNEEGASQAPAVTALLDDLASQPDDGDDTPITAAQLQQAVDAANAVQQLVALGAEDAVPTALADTLTEENLELLGLTGLTPAPSPYLAEFLSVLKAAADDGSATDTVAELQSLLDSVIAEILVAPVVTTANGDGLSGTGTAGDTIALLDGDGNPVLDGEGNPVTATVGEDGTWSIPASAFPGETTDGFAGSVTATDAAGNESAPATIEAIDGTAPDAPGVEDANADGLSGTGTAGDVITLFDDSEPPVAIATATVGEDGTWSIPASAFPGETTDGFAGSVTATDAAGNESAPATIEAIDGTAPDAPGVEDANADGLSGTGTAGDVITLFDDSEPPVAIATATVGEDGTWSIPASAFPGETTDGFAGSVTATDAAGNESAPATIEAIDGTAPDAPGVEDANADGLSGTGTAGDVITLFDDSEPPVAIATATVGEDGTWSIPASAFPGETTDGFAGSVTATDAAGNESAPATIEAIDGTAPDAPGVEDANADGLSGTGTAGDVITLFDDSEPPVAIATATVGEDGTWSIPASAFPGETTDGFAGSVTATDAAGNESAPATIEAIDGTAPDAPGVEDANADGLSGTGTAGDVITLFDDSEPPVAIATATVGEDGTWSIPASAFPGETTDGFAGSVTATDAAGNESAPATIEAIDGTAPDAPGVEDANADGLSGTGTAGDVITLFDDSEPPVAIATATVGEDGTWSIPASAFPGETTDGFAGSVTATDAAGNESAPATIEAIDGTAPDAPGVEDANADGLSGTGTAGDVITLFDDSEPPVAIATATVGEDGTWSIPASAFPGETTDGFAGSVTATDAAGNESAPATIEAIDGTAPDAPGVEDANADGLSGTGTAGDVITLFDDSEPPVAIATATVGEDGTWSIPASAFPGETTDGFAGSVTATDAAGNESAPATIEAIDGTAPDAPGVEDANADGLSGTGTAGDVITLFDDSEPPVAIATATVGEDGTWSIPASAFPGETTDGFAGSVTATDAAGNESAPATIEAIDGTAPDAPGVEDANADGLSGTGTAGDVITLFDDSEPPVAIATATVGEDGTWSIPASAFPGETTDGFAGSVTATDAAGNESAPATIEAIDGTAPDAPGVEDANADGLSGTGTAGDVITLFDDSEPPVAIATATVGEDGTWSIPASAFPGETTDGFAGSVTATDAAGNESAPATIEAIDGTAPDAPGVEDANADGLSGTGTAGDVITLFDDSEPPVAIATATVGEDGTWSIPASAFPGETTDGFAGSVTATDAAGNESAPATIEAIDGTAAAPVVETANANGLTGTAEPNSTITLFDDSEPPVAIAIATADGDGNWSIPASAFPGGDPVGFSGAVTQEDAAGNVSESAGATIGSKTMIYFGTFADVDPVEGGALSVRFRAENEADLLNEEADYQTLQSVFVSISDVASPFGAINDNDVPNGDTITYNRGAGQVTVQADSSLLGSIEVTLRDGTTQTIDTVFLQTDNGDLFIGDLNNNGSLDNLEISNIRIATITDNGTQQLSAFLSSQSVDGTTFGPTAPTIDPGITDQANTVSGTGDPGATVTVSDASGVIGSAVVWTDGRWSLVTDSPVEDGAELTAVQSFAGTNDSPVATQTTFTDTDGDNTANTADTDDDEDGIVDTVESVFESTVNTSAATTPATSTVGSPTTGYVETSRVVDGGSITIEATAPGEVGSNPNVAGQNLGTRSSFTVQVDPTDTEIFDNATISIAINAFDDGLFVQINDAVIVDFNAGDWFFNPGGTQRTTGVNFNFDTNGDGRWRPWTGEGNPSLEINTATRTVQLLVDTAAGGREDVLAAIALETITFNTPGGSRDPRPDPLPTLDAAAFEAGVTITTAYNNLDNVGVIGDQVITVSAEFSGADDIDGDGIANWVDIDTDDDGIWDKYELTTDNDGDAVADYRDTDSNGAAGLDDRGEASLTAENITALETLDETNNDGFILLSDAGLNLDLNATGFSITGLEYIDMEDGVNAQTVSAEADALIAVTDPANELIIVGDAFDSVNAVGFQDTGKDQSIEGQKFSIFEAESDGVTATLIIDDDITVVLA